MDVDADVGLIEVGDAGWIGELRRVVDFRGLAVRRLHPVDDRGGRSDEVHLEFAFEAFLNDLHVQEAEEAAAEAEAEGLRGFRFP